MKLITLFIMNIEFVLFLTDDSYALQYGVYMERSSGTINYLVDFISHNIYDAAMISLHNNKLHVKYYENNLAHCLSGPANIAYYADGNVHYFTFHTSGERNHRYTYWMYIWDIVGNVTRVNHIGREGRYEKIPSGSDLDPRITEIRLRKTELWLSLQNLF